MAFETIRYSVEGGIARLTLDRPDRLNSFTDAMHEEVRTALTALEADRSARVLVLTGAGRGFCAGQDLNDRSVAAGEAAPDLGASVEQNYKPLVLRLQALRMPTVCAVNGVAAGAGASLALACDIVIAARSASFLQAFSKVGLIPDSGGTWFLPQRVGMARAMGLALLAEKLPAEKAAEWGLIWSCVDDAELMPTVDGIAARLAAAPTRALVRTREALRASMSQDLAAQLDLERDFMRELGRSADYREGVAAFMAKRVPQFTGE
ncbi:MAG: 2-(1,2-epoxy-1,2-dihydrophenyl)acetyl-CoA isomerase PaaG [Gammaproteobacteria bacterium]|nr:2-(1,2-epoxy-1,2-dihydrophenyl)acetyl-CoA isomerase PaaG [Gammaproteobacteria bacterium]MBU1644939.1 2-(1,2-epoxy-1,2-dihydrophenyl)acetyl-CoA isomerase PaaG [Gammaproteobacteria bacterium]MBU1971398.1 2-(1,2-epoxy-1,2-dihydrophenyl)acetyl-CoA isomerase PaaG [Gammaproteobacteria bacterium]